MLKFLVFFGLLSVSLQSHSEALGKNDQIQQMVSRLNQVTYFEEILPKKFLPSHSLADRDVINSLKKKFGKDRVSYFRAFENFILSMDANGSIEKMMILNLDPLLILTQDRIYSGKSIQDLRQFLEPQKSASLLSLLVPTAQAQWYKVPGAVVAVVTDHLTNPNAGRTRILEGHIDYTSTVPAQKPLSKAQIAAIYFPNGGSCLAKSNTAALSPMNISFRKEKSEKGEQIVTDISSPTESGFIRITSVKGNVKKVQGCKGDKCDKIQSDGSEGWASDQFEDPKRRADYNAAADMDSRWTALFQEFYLQPQQNEEILKVLTSDEILQKMWRSYNKRNTALVKQKFSKEAKVHQPLALSLTKKPSPLMTSVLVPEEKSMNFEQFKNFVKRGTTEKGGIYFSSNERLAFSVVQNEISEIRKKAHSDLKYQNQSDQLFSRIEPHLLEIEKKFSSYRGKSLDDCMDVELNFSGNKKVGDTRFETRKAQIACAQQALYSARSAHIDREFTAGARAVAFVTYSECCLDTQCRKVYKQLLDKDKKSEASGSGGLVN